MQLEALMTPEVHVFKSIWNIDFYERLFLFPLHLFGSVHLEKKIFLTMVFFIQFTFANFYRETKGRIQSLRITQTLQN